MPIPLAVSVPAAAAALSYLDAKSGFWYDRKLVRGGMRALWQNNYRQWKDRSNVFYRLEQRAQEKSSANRPFLLHQDRTWTYAQAYEMALRYGTYFKNTFGVKPKDIVAVNLMNSDHFVLVVFGLWSIGAKPAYINYNLTSDSLVHCVNVAKATLMLVDPEVAKNVDDDVRAKIGGLRVELLSPELIREVGATEATRAPDTCRIGEIGRDMAILIYTSGTTGLPKAAVIGWSKLILAGNFCAGWLDTKPTDIFYTCMPLYHSSATSMGLAQCIEAGCTLAIGKRFSTKTFWAEARAHRATIVQYVGETCRYLLAAPPQLDPATGANLDQQHCIRMAFGNGLRPDVWEKFRARFGIRDIAEFYGATEGPLATWNLTHNEFSSGAIGRNGWLYGLAMRHKMAIVAVDDADSNHPGADGDGKGDDGLVRDPRTGLGKAVRNGDIGELLFALPGTDVEREFQGYYGDAEATKKKIARDVFRKGDAYFRSGDLVSWDDEGRVYFHDRIGDTFRWKSENVATTEVAQALGSHEGVAEANVYGVLLPHHDGRAGAAAVVLRGGGGGGEGEKGGDERTLLRSLAEHLRARLPRYAVPLFVRVCEDLGHAVTGTNKQQKHHLRVEGVDPAKVGKDRLFWLRDGTYVPFGPKEWQKLSAGDVKL